MGSNVMVFLPKTYFIQFGKSSSTLARGKPHSVTSSIYSVILFRNILLSSKAIYKINHQKASVKAPSSVSARKYLPHLYFLVLN